MKITIVPSRQLVARALAIGCAIALAGCQSGPTATVDHAAAVAATPVVASAPLAVAAVTRPAAPTEVVSLAGRNVVLNQGTSALEAGTIYQAVRVDTGDANAESGAPCCSIQVDRVVGNEAYGHIVDADFHQAGKFVPGSIELRGPVPLQSVVAVTARMVATN